MFDDIILFIHIVRCRSLGSAAERLQLPAATVTRRLQRLETRLKCCLIHRSARQFNLTAEGEVYFQAYADLVQQFETTARQLDVDMHQLSGKLKVLAPTNISNDLLHPMWTAFIKAYPEIQLQLFLNNKTEDLQASQADIALRAGPQPDSDLHQKRLGVVSTILVAAPEYIRQHGSPANLAELDRHHLIVVDAISIWNLFNCETEKSTVLRPEATTIVSDIRLANRLASDGVGITLLPMSEINQALQEHKLQRILQPWSGPQRGIFAVWPSGRLLSAKAKCLRDFMQDYIARDPLLQGGI
ncbi:MAG: LysR family transcriptional regulator [Arenicella sp.]